MKESLNQNIKNIGIGIAATVASVGIPEDAVAQQGLLGKIKDKIKDKIEMVESKQQPVEIKQETKKDSIIYNWEGDKTGFKYPFDKEYKSDEDFYRTVGYGRSYNLDTSHSIAQHNAENKIFREELNLKGNFEAQRGNLSVIDVETFKNNEGIFTTVVVIEVAKKDVVLFESKAEDKSEKSPIIETEKTRNEKIGENISGEWQKYEVEKPEKPPISNKPVEQPVYHPTPKVEKSDYQVTFEDFKKSKEAEFESFKKSQEEEFNKFKEGK